MMDLKNLTYRFQFIQIIRDFFNEKGFIDVITPPVVENPGMEVHIHPFQVHSARDRSLKNLFLHTSPEFKMKELLSYAKTTKIKNAFTISYCFRDEPQSVIHREQFLMLEWYRVNSRYEKIAKDIEELIPYILKKLEAQSIPFSKKLLSSSFKTLTVQDLFKEYLDINILDFQKKSDLVYLIKNSFSNEIKIPDIDCEWDDYFFLLFLNLIEPKLKNIPFLILKEYPAPLAALSTIKKEDPRVCERFEFYVNGVEVANCFNELTNLSEQKKRFKDQANQKKEEYHYELPSPDFFYKSLERGLPECSGIALGIERLMKEILGLENPFWD